MPTLNLPGVHLYYEVHGTGPVLLLIPGGPTDTGIFAGLAAALANRYTVVLYDPRGNSRSVLDGPPEDQRMDVHGDDAASLCGVSQDLFSRLENGKPVRTDKLMQVLQGLGLNLFAVHNESASRLERALDNLRMRDREGAQ